MQELKETTNAYQRAKLGMQERDFLIATHRRSEAAILNQSEQLTQELRTANAAMDDMQARLGTRGVLLSSISNESQERQTVITSTAYQSAFSLTVSMPDRRCRIVNRGVMPPRLVHDPGGSTQRRLGHTD